MLTRRRFVQSVGIGAAGVAAGTFIGARGRENSVWEAFEPTLQAIEPGVICLAKPGDRVEAGQPLLELRADDPGRFGPALDALAGAAAISAQAPPAALSPVIEVVTPR